VGEEAPPTQGDLARAAAAGRNVVERCFCRLKDWRRIATRYDKLARNFLSALCFVAMLAYWL
jgi:transposase